MKRPSDYSCEINWWLKQHLNYSLTLKRKRTIKSLRHITKQFNAVQNQRYQQLSHHYALSDWPQLCSQTELIENLYLLDLLDQHIHLSATVTNNANGLDIGCRNFSHLPALSAFAPYSWKGVELDAHARYLNGYTRRAYGEWMAKQREGACYTSGSLLTIEGSYHIISWILPFIVEAPLKQWGLPHRFFQPQQLLEKACSLLHDDGVMLIVNQGEREAEVQQQLFDVVQINAKSLGPIDSVFSPFKHERYGWLVIQNTTSYYSFKSFLSF